MSAKAKAAHVWPRDPDEWYVEPEGVTTALLTVERFPGFVLDPCCGQGNIVKALRASGVTAFGCDKVRRVPADCDWFIKEEDFLTRHHPFVDAFVMNPPFGRARLAEAFIRHALNGQRASKVAAFVDLRFITGKQRASGLFAEHPPSRIWIITPRPSCPPGTYLAAGHRAGGGQADYCWLVWDLTAPRPITSIGWLRQDGAA